MGAKSITLGQADAACTYGSSGVKVSEVAGQIDWRHLPAAFAKDSMEDRFSSRTGADFYTADLLSNFTAASHSPFR